MEKGRRDVAFERVRPRKVSAVAAEQIVEAIQRGDYPVGSKLPSEFELADLMGISRPSVREALSALQAMNIIESRPGSGNYVRRAPTAVDEDGTLHLIECEAGCLEVMEARGVLEPPVAALVAGKASDEQTGELERILDEMEQHASHNDFEHYFQADKEFHRALAEAAGNPLVSSALRPLVQTMDQRVYQEFTRHYYLRNVDDLMQVVSLHREILDAIITGDQVTAREKMVEHWSRMREIWEA
jgi:GntR family transcriptional repressor for pyruvate dehydrogenase complex